jgi:hypothetical protein
VVAGGLLALLIIPVGVLIFVLISSIGFVASITGFVIALGAVWLYGKGSGGVITRAGAWIVTSIVVVTLLLAFYISMVVDFANDVSKDLTSQGQTISAVDVFNRPAFWSVFNENVGAILSDNALYFVIALLLGLLGSFRTLRRAFATSGAPSGVTSAATVSPTRAAQSSTYLSDVGGAPTASADEKTPPPSSQV